ncbi:MAG: sigma factor, subfamily protein [Pedosphaera sp.]|nr:sigma factor, subfamily protein [Pedosphaera sp.]
MKPNTPPVSPTPGADVSQVVDHLFRHEAGKVVAILTRIMGLHQLQLAEDAVQEALLKAMQVWPFGAMPANPTAWITRVARNYALDRVRREQNFKRKEEEIIGAMEHALMGGPESEPVYTEEEIFDDQLRMLFTCCHPVISQDDQVALSLKTLCGFSTAEIAAAFLSTEAGVAKRLVRAKQKIREARIAFEIPSGQELSNRLDSVLQALYLLFNEGYKASKGEALVRQDLVEEAIRLTGLLARHPAGNEPRTHALLALMFLAGARLPARVDGDGSLLPLAEQDRSSWDRSMMSAGFAHLAQSAAGDQLSEYHLQAGIAAAHCAAEDYSATDWKQILGLYDRLIELNNSPVIALNRAVAISKVHGPLAALEAMETLRGVESMKAYYLFHAVLGQFHLELEYVELGHKHLRRALELTTVQSERAFLLGKLGMDVEKV